MSCRSCWVRLLTNGLGYKTRLDFNIYRHDMNVMVTSLVLLELLWITQVHMFKTDMINKPFC